MAARRTRSKPATPAAKRAEAEGGAPRRPRVASSRALFLLAGAVIAIAIGLLYREIAFQGKIFFASDNQAAASFAAVGKKSLAAGEYPLWNPYLFGGMPSLGSLSYTPYLYPVNYLIGVLDSIPLFPKYGWLLFHTFLTGIGTYLLLRDRGLHAAAAIPAGVLMTWMPNLVAVGANGHGSQACAVAYLPLALVFWDRVWRGRGVLVNGAALAIVLGFSMLRAHLQISYYTYALVVLHLLFFGVARIVDGARGRADAASPVPARLAVRLLPANATPLRRALTETAFAAGVLVVAAGVSLLMSAVLYLPVQDYAQYSIRGASTAGGVDYGYATSWSLHPGEMLTFLIPFSFGFGKDLYLGHMPFTDYPNYLGIVVLMFAGLAVAVARSRWVAFLGFVAAVATLTSFGKFFPVLYDPLFKFAPFFSKFRVPVMVLIVQQLAVVALFAIGLDALLRGDRARARRWALRMLMAAGVVFLAALFSQGYWTGGFAEDAAARVRAQDPGQQRAAARMAGEFLAADLVQIGVIGLLLALSVFAFTTAKRMRVAVLAAIVLLLGAADYYRVNRFILHPETFIRHDAYRIIRDPAATSRYSERDDLIDYLQTLPGPYRVFAMDSPERPFSALFSSNRFMVFDIGSVGGYHPAKLSAYDDFLRALGPSLAEGRFDLLNMMNAKYFVTGARLPDHPSFTPLWAGRDFEGQARAVYENREAFPRAWVTGAYRVASSADTPALLAAGEVDLARTAILENPPVPEPVPGDSAAVDVTAWTPHSMTLRTELDRPGIVVVSEVFYPDWKATVNGEPAEILRANHVLRALALPAGRHEIVFRYDGTLFRRGVAVSMASFAAAVLLLGAGLVARRRRSVAGEGAWTHSS